MRSLVFDTGPIITLTLNNLIWLLEPLQKRFGGDFCITPKVYEELINKPLSTKKYKLEALQILPYISKGILKIRDKPEIHALAVELQELANSAFEVHGNRLKIVHLGEMEAIACAIAEGADTIVIDERTTRVLVESPMLLEKHLGRKLHAEVTVNNDKLQQLTSRINSLKVIRSFELAIVAHDLGLLDIYALDAEQAHIPNIKRAVLEGVLWGVKLNGCSVRREDIYTVLG
jgi:predicted nucleic acid-binding protein